jgi:hypothetical protein
VSSQHFGPRPRPAGLAQPQNQLAGPSHRHDAGTVGLRRGVDPPVARAPWVYDECARQGEWEHDSPSKRGGDEAVEMSFDGGVPDRRRRSSDPMRQRQPPTTPE